MSEDKNDISEMDQELAAFGCCAEDVRDMSFMEKKELISTFRLSMGHSGISNREKEAALVRTPASQMDELQLRLQKAGVSMTSFVGKPSIDDDSDEVVVLKEFESPHCSSLRRPPIHSASGSMSKSPAIGSYRTTPISRVTPTPTTPTSRVTPVRARKKIELVTPTKEAVVSPVTPEATEHHEVMPPQDYVKHRAEIYAMNPFSCVDTALSTLAETSSFPKKKKKNVPFFYSEHALSLKMDDYIALFVRKLGFSSAPVAPVIPDEVEETAEETPKVIEPTGYDECLGYPSLEESTSNSKYNLRQRTAPKRTVKDYEFTISDDDDSDDIITSKRPKIYEKDGSFSKEEAKAPIAKTRVNKLSLQATKIAAERNAKPYNELVTVDSDNSCDSDVPGKEVYVPKLQYSAVVTNDATKWKSSKTRVSAVPKGQGEMVQAIDAMAEIQSVKPRQTRGKPSDAIKPGPISGKNRRAALAEGSATRKTARGKQVNKKESESDVNDGHEEQMPELFSCPLCKEEFPQAEIEAHVNACCDESASHSLEGECPVCFKYFLLKELPNHSSSCDGKSENLDMEQD